SKTLWVGNIDSAISVEELTQVFSDYGPIESIRLLLEKECGFINFYHQKDAIQAKEDISKRLGGRIGPYTLRVGYGKVDNITNEIPVVMQPTRALWLGNMPPNITDVTLQKIFSPFGIIESVRVLSYKHCGFINYDTTESASAARDSILGDEIQELIGVRVGFAKVHTSTEKILENHDINVYTELESILKQFGANESSFFLIKSLKSTSYFESIPLVPEYSSSRKVDIQRLKDIRKKLDKIENGHTEADDLAFECLNEVTMICSDYIGNTVIQRLFEKCSEEMKTKMLHVIVPHLASIGVHKNGTWAAQKIIELANTEEQMNLICQHLQPFIPPLLLDPFGNYVVQGCLRLNCNTQFIINAVVDKLAVIVQGRFGTRAVRGILESEFITQSQQILIAAALIQNALSLSTHTNGILALSCLIDSPLMENKRWIISSRLALHITELATHKFGSHILLKLIYHYENEAQKCLLEALEDEKVLLSIISDHSHGLPFILKIILSQRIPEEYRVCLQDIAHPLLTQIRGVRYKKALLEFVNLE
ncbi:ARM repeat-containing protein, partial [Backusella circina FSU 941]